MRSGCRRALNRAGIRSQLFRAPRDLTDLGCAYVVRIAPYDLGAALPAPAAGGTGPPADLCAAGRGYSGRWAYDLSGQRGHHLSKAACGGAGHGGGAGLHELAGPGRATRWPCGLRTPPSGAGRSWRSCFSLDGPERVVFTSNATHGLNIAIKSLVPPGGRVVISGYEHNAVTRPLAALDAKVSVADGPLFHPEAVTEAFDEPDRARRGRCDLQPCVQRVRLCPARGRAVAALCRSRGVPLIDRRLPVRRDPAAGSGKPWGGVYCHAGPQGAVRPPGHRRAAVRGRTIPEPAAGGRHGQHLSQSGDAGLPAGPAGGRDPQYARHRRAAGGRSTLSAGRGQRPFCAMSTP